MFSGDQPALRGLSYNEERDRPRAPRLHDRGVHPHGVPALRRRADATLGMVPCRAGSFAGFPDGYREGLPTSHGQHTCILLLNVTERCNFACPTCYADALAPGTPPSGEGQGWGLANHEALHPQPLPLASERKGLEPTIPEMLHTVDTTPRRREKTRSGSFGLEVLASSSYIRLTLLETIP